MAKNNDADNVFTTSEGVKIRLKPVDVLKVQTTIRSVEDPPRPTYIEYIGFNKRPNEVEIKDEETAKQVENGEELWRAYQEALDDASSKRTDKSLRIIFLTGTEVPDNDDWVTEKWLAYMDFMGLEIPEIREYAWVTYLLTNYSGEEILQLSQKIMRLTGVPEEILQVAEETFQSAVQDGSGTE